MTVRELIKELKLLPEHAMDKEIKWRGRQSIKQVCINEIRISLNRTILSSVDLWSHDGVIINNSNGCSAGLCKNKPNE